MTNLEKALFIATQTKEIRINNGKILLYTRYNTLYRLVDWTQEQYEKLKKIVRKNGGVVA